MLMMVVGDVGLENVCVRAGIEDGGDVDVADRFEFRVGVNCRWAGFGVRTRWKEGFRSGYCRRLLAGVFRQKVSHMK